MRNFLVNFDDENIKGHITIEMIPGRDRLRILRDINLIPDENGTITFNNGMIESIIKGTEIIEKKIVEVDLVINGETIKSFEDLEYSSGFNAVIMRLITFVINGPERLGK